MANSTIDPFALRISKGSERITKLSLRGEHCGEGALILSPHSNSLPPGEREAVFFHSFNEGNFCWIAVNSLYA